MIKAADEIFRLQEENKRLKENAIIIPEGATNGDILKITFNPHKIFKFTNCVQVYFSEKYYQFFGIEWWNAPYKGVEE